jgi:hypothetical protein
VRRAFLGGAALAGAAAVLAFGSPLYARFLAAAVALTHPGVVVRPHGSAMVVHAEPAPGKVSVDGIFWNLPVLVCLWVLVVGGRWRLLTVAVLLLGALQVGMAHLEAGIVLGRTTSLRYGLVRAWHHGAAALLPLAVVAWGALSRPPRHGVAPSEAA